MLPDHGHGARPYARQGIRDPSEQKSNWRRSSPVSHGPRDCTDAVGARAEGGDQCCLRFGVKWVCQQVKLATGLNRNHRLRKENSSGGDSPKKSIYKACRAIGMQKTEDGHDVPDSPELMIDSQILFFFLSMRDLTERFQRGEKAVVRVWGVLETQGSRGADSFFFHIFFITL